MWTKECQKAFREAKRLVTSDQVLCHYDPNLPIRLACDASPFGLGAVLSHVMKDGTEHPIAFASRTLNKAERNYSQIDKEALSIVFGVKKFHTYLYGREFTLITDHQPLVSIFNPKKGISVTSAARMQRHAIFLSGYTYSIEYRNTKRHTNADGLSRFPQEENEIEAEELTDVADMFTLSQMEQLPCLTHEEIRRETSKDKMLSQVYDCIMNGWADNDDPNLHAYFNRKNELTVSQGCIMWGCRVIIPKRFRDRVLEMFHSAHPGIVRMKLLTRSYVWWPGIDSEIEKLVKGCSGCQKQRNNPKIAPLHPWEWPSAPWKRIHVDFAGPFLGHMFLIVVDAHSKWPEVIPMQTTTSAKTIITLRNIFARNGLPEQMVSDNGPQFVSEEFQKFVKLNGIRHIRSAPYHPATNGLAERFVQTFKQGMKAMDKENADIHKKLANFLLTYRNTPHATTNETPASLFMGRNLRCRFDLIKPDLRRTVQNKQMKTAISTKAEKLREFETGQQVAVRDYRGKEKWTSGEVIQRKGPLNYEVKTEAGGIWKRHADQIRDSEFKAETLPHSDVIIPIPQACEVDETADSEPAITITPPGRRYPLRTRKPVVKMNL
jgi:hypothetical protein